MESWTQAFLRLAPTAYTNDNRVDTVSYNISLVNMKHRSRKTTQQQNILKPSLSRLLLPKVERPAPNTCSCPHCGASHVKKGSRRRTPRCIDCGAEVSRQGIRCISCAVERRFAGTAAFTANLLVDRFGLNGVPASTVREIAQARGMSYADVYTRIARGLHTLVGWRRADMTDHEIAEALRVIPELEGAIIKGRGAWSHLRRYKGQRQAGPGE